MIRLEQLAHIGVPPMGRSRILGLPELSSHTYEGGHRPSESSGCWGPTYQRGSSQLSNGLLPGPDCIFFPLPGNFATCDLLSINNGDGHTEENMNGLIYLVGLIVVILAILSFFGLR